MPGFIYFLQGRDKRYYVGSTNDVVRRFEQHKNGLVYSTRRMLTVELVFYQEVGSLKEARALEKLIKKMKRHDLIECIICEKDIFAVLKKDKCGPIAQSVRAVDS